MERESRAARLAHLFGDEDMLSGEDDLLDTAAADKNAGSFLDKIDNHLKMEKRILEAWHEKDDAVNAAAKGGPKWSLILQTSEILN